MVNKIFYTVKLELIKNPDKTFIERVVGVFDFLGTPLNAWERFVSMPAISQLCESIVRIY
jgi:hypothetical protein